MAGQINNAPSASEPVETDWPHTWNDPERDTDGEITHVCDGKVYYLPPF